MESEKREISYFGKYARYHCDIGWGNRCNHCYADISPQNETNEVCDWNSTNHTDTSIDYNHGTLELKSKNE